jgi:hypothetical protein
MAAFDELKRERLLALMEAGQTVAQACAATGVGRATVTRWAAAGQEPTASTAAREFSRRYAELRQARRPTNGNGNGHGGPLSDEELVVVLEDSARRGSAEAAKMLLGRRKRQERAVEKAEPAEPLIDPMTWLHPAEMAELTEEQRQQAREVYVAAVDARPPHHGHDDWQEERALILSGEWDVEPSEHEKRARRSS